MDDIPITQFAIGSEYFWLIEDFDHFITRWEQAVPQEPIFRSQARRKALLDEREPDSSSMVWTAGSLII